MHQHDGPLRCGGGGVVHLMILELADLHDVPIVDNSSIEGSVMLVIRHVVETLREKEGVNVSDLL